MKNLPPDPDNMNCNRARWAGAALSAFETAVGDKNGASICDLLCNLMHWCDRNNKTFDDELLIARKYYEDETSTDEGEEHAVT